MSFRVGEPVSSVVVKMSEGVFCFVLMQFVCTLVHESERDTHSAHEMRIVYR